MPPMTREEARSAGAPYNYGLLNDLHDIFPEVLYDDEIFTSPLVQFIQNRVSHMFPNSYHHQRSNYLRTQGESRRRGLGANRNTRYPAAPSNATTATIPILSFFDPQPTAAATNVANDFLRNLLLEIARENENIEPSTNPVIINNPPNGLSNRRRVNPVGRGFWDPIVVRPSAEVYAANTEILAGDAVSDDIICTICQSHEHDVPAETASWRKIRRCGHLFHKACADRWFALHIQCPVCRGDIREAAPRPSTIVAVAENPSSGDGN